MANGNEDRARVPKEQISLDELTENLGKWQEPSPLVQIGYKLARLLLLFLSIVCILLLGDYLLNTPPVPDISQLNAEHLEQYRELSQIVTERNFKLFDLFFKSFLPIFTAILGYIFGTHSNNKDDT